MSQQKTKGRAANKINMTLKHIEPLTEAQAIMYESNKDVVAHGSAGTGKTFMGLYMGLEEVIRKDNFSHITIIRSAVPTREIGFLPGNDKEKVSVYQNPYREIATELFGRADAYDYLESKGLVRFMSTSFIRGCNLTNSFILVDEYQNMDFHELDTVMTRGGHNSRYVFSGDTMQADLRAKSGIEKFNNILTHMGGFDFVEFTTEDIVRGPRVREYLETKYRLG